jgi:type III pantothenate kinase
MMPPMEINLLVVGVGNSRLHVAAFVGGELQHVRHLAHAQRADWPSLLAEIWAEISNAGNAEVAGCCVVPGLLAPVGDAIREATGQDVQWVGTEIPLPIAVTTKEPKKTGVDRALVTAAAYEQLRKACVVVDAGTALTVNLCNNEGALVGGAIAPGASAMLESLSAKAAQLPDVAFVAPETEFGTDTVDAMRHGVVGALRGLVQSMAERWAEKMGTWPEVIATGGDAAALFDGWEVVHAISPDLLMYGIALAYTEDKLKRDEA